MRQSTKQYITMKKSMKPLLYSFGMFIRQISKDSMLLVVLIAPILAAFFFRFGIPIIERLLTAYLQETAILSSYYLLFDLFLSMLTPYMFCFASAMVMLTEYDENMTSYLAVTPIGKKGYILSRLVFPAAISFLGSVLLLLYFSLTEWSMTMIVLICLLTSLASIAVALLVFSVSHNRVEGMAMSKLSGLMMMGLPVPFFLLSSVQYLFAVLPSFWIAKLSLEQNLLYFILAILTSLIWIWLLYRKFEIKL